LAKGYWNRYFTGRPEETIQAIHKDTEWQQSDINKLGVGLGLSIANALAVILSGTAKLGIDVRSVLDEGSTFSFTFEEKSQEVGQENSR